MDYNSWGRKIKLKYDYKDQQPEVKKIKMTKEEFNKYIEELENKNKYKKYGLKIMGVDYE